MGTRALLSGEYVCAEESITHPLSVDADELIAKSREVALDATVLVLERFNWMHPPVGILAEEQSKLLERRRD
jgi:hypothetical protein